MLKITVLGCGASGGVPLLKYGWGRCDAGNPKNSRSRSSVMIETEKTRLLVDMSPDLRQQMFNFGSSQIDGVFFTHDHYDHTSGINELRPVYFGGDRPLRIYARKDVMEDLKKAFYYVFEDSGKELYKSYIEANIVDTKFSIGDISASCFEQDHGYSKSTGIRIGDFAYTTDVLSFKGESFEQLRELEVWIVGCLSRDAKPTHANLDTVLKWVDELKPRRTYLTHMSADLDYESLLAELPPNVRPAYDGMRIFV